MGSCTKNVEPLRLQMKPQPPTTVTEWYMQKSYTMNEILANLEHAIGNLLVESVFSECRTSSGVLSPPLLVVLLLVGLCVCGV